MTGFATFAVTVSSTYLLNAYGMELKPSNQTLLETLGNQWPTLITILAFFIAPVFEELFFRKQLFARFAAAGYAVFGYLLSSLLFALLDQPLSTQGITRWLLMLAVYGSIGAALPGFIKRPGAYGQLSWRTPAIIFLRCRRY